MTTIAAKSHFPKLHFTNPIPISGTPVLAMQQFEREFISFMNYWKLPGAAIAVVKNGKLVYSRGFGWADIQTAQPVQPDSLFRVASVSKTFTVAAILKLAQEGRLNLNDKVFDLLNDLQPLNGRSPNPRIYNIRIIDLLHMSSGWFLSGACHIDPMFGPWPKSMVAALGKQVPASCEDTVRMMMSIPLRYAPGSAYAYSNLDYCLLGLVIDKVMHQPYNYGGYEHFVQESILTPLGIHNMSIGSTLLSQRLPGEVRYYRPNAPMTQDELENSAYLPYSYTQLLHKNFANGGWIASAPDIAKFMYDLKTGKIIDHKYLSYISMRPAFVGTKRKNFYTMGMQMYRLNKQWYWIQTGSYTGTNAMVLIKPDNTTIVIVFNAKPSAYTFFTKFRPELKSIMLSKHFNVL